MRIRQKYTLTLLFTAVIPLLFAMIFALWHSRDLTTQLTINNAENKLQSASETLNGFFLSRISEISAYTESPLLKTMDFKKIRPFIMSELGRHQGIYEKFILGTPESHFYNTSGGNPGNSMLRTFNDKDPKAKPKSIAKRDYWQETVGKNIRHQKISIVSDPMISYTTGAKQIVVASSIRQDGQVVGMLGGALPWKDMELRLSDLFAKTFSEDQLNKQVFLVSHTGIYWYHWDQSKVVHLKTDEKSQPILNEMGQKTSMVSSILDDPNLEFAEIGENILSGKKGYESYLEADSGTTNFVVYTPVPATKYSIGIVIPESVIFAPVYSLEKLFMFTLLVVVIMALVFAVVNSRKIYWPILQLNKATKQINDGNLQEINITQSNDEIGELANSFNNMIVGLRNERNAVIQRETEITDLNRSLEQKVSDRTQELEKINDQLETKIREYSETKDQLLKHEKLLQNTGKLAKVGGWQSDIGKEALDLTNELYDLLDLPRSDIVTRTTLINLINQTYRDEFVKLFEQAKTLGSPFEIDVKMSTSTDREIWCRIIGAPKKINSDITSVSGAIQDITQLKKVDKLKNEFVSTVSHEIRTPLTSITGSIILIKSGVTGELNEKTRDLIELIDRNANRLLFLINDILDIEKIESGNLEFNFADVDLKGLLIQAIETNQSYANKFDCRFELVETIENIQLQADSQRLMQVMANLMSNAAKFSQPNSAINIGMLLMEDQIVRVYVKDNGEGISEEFKSKIFEKFTQADGSTNRKHAGTGLGLSISKAILEQHGGRLDFESSNKGSIFFFDLPIKNHNTIVNPVEKYQ